MKSLTLLKFAQKFFGKDTQNSQNKRLIIRSIITCLAIVMTQKQLWARSPFLRSPSQPSLNYFIPSPVIDNSDNFADSILPPEIPSVEDESDQDLISPGFRKLMYLGVFILFIGIIIAIGMLSKQIARALIGASLLTIVFLVLFFVIL